MLTIHFDANSQLPLYEQIYQYIRQEIRNGNLTNHAKLPSTRKLAEHLQISRNTVDMAYDQLLSEGYIESSPKRGYFVCPVTQLAAFSSPAKQAPEIPKIALPAYKYDFSPFAIDISNFPYATWRKLSNNCMNNTNDQLFLLGDRQGDPSFRKAIAAYLHESRGVNCSIDQIIIGAGADYLLQLLSLLLTSKSIIAMENPTYKQAYMIFHGLKLGTVPISLDDSGMNVTELIQSDANICYLTPSHQYPMGIIMPIKRRLDLLNWANQAEDRYIIEDDHDSEFRYKGKPIPALQGMDRNDKVIYLGTFSRAIAPAIRIGYMVLPNQLLNVYRKEFSYYASTVSRVDQALLTSFLEGGYFERHLNRMRKIYKGKHDTLLTALKQFGDEISIYNENAGLHLLVRFHGNYTQEELLNTAQTAGIKLYPLSEHYIKPVKHEGIDLLIGYGNVSEDQITEGIKKLYQVLHS